MLRHLQRAFFYLRPRSMPEAVDGSTDATLKRFEDALRQHAPDVLATLQPGLSDERIREIDARFRLRLTDDLRALYRWRNGSAPEQRVELIRRPLVCAAGVRGGTARRNEATGVRPGARATHCVLGLRWTPHEVDDGAR